MSTIIVFVSLLSVLVFVHELGHFAAAKLAGICVDEFGIGFPPRALTLFKKGETKYTLNWLPIGGFVKLFGEEYTENSKYEARNSKQTRKSNDKNSKQVSDFGFRDSDFELRAFYAQSGWVKSAVLTAGVLMNYLLGLVLIMVVFWGLGVPQVDNIIEIQEVAPNSPAAQAGLEKEDVITRINGQEIESSEQVVEIINENKGKTITAMVRDVQMEGTEGDEGASKRTVQLKPRSNPPENEGAIGITFAVVPRVEYQKIAWWKVPGLAVGESVRLVGLMVTGIGQILGDLITQGVIPQDIAGPVGIAKITGQVAREGLYQLLQFGALLSINLAVINLLPFPALDGGRLVFVAAEGIAGRRLAPKWQTWINVAGMIALLALMVLITVYDVVRIF